MKANVLIVEDNDTVQRLYRRHLFGAGYDVQCAATLAEAREAVAARRFDAVLLDLNLPDGSGLDWVHELRQAHVASAIVMVTGDGDVPQAVEAMRRGADNFLVKPVDMEALTIFLKKAMEIGNMRRGQMTRRRTVKLIEPFFGDAPAMQQVFALAQTATANESAVVISGETGAGKGVLARWIHEHSPRAAAPFVEVNCSSLRGELLSSELFGHTRGAFTSAVEDRQGLIEVADGGTLFLDEIGDMDLTVQAQFLKVIEEKRYRRLGEVRMRTSEFRLICATNHNLDAQARAGTFRRDLFFRINVFPITVPPLRAVPSNIPGLTQHLLRYLTPRGIEVDPAVYDVLQVYPWPGNVRELRNVLERALVLGGNRLGPEHFRVLAENPAPAGPAGEGSSLRLADEESRRIREAMERFAGDTRKAAAALGISRATLYRRLKDLKAQAE
jgi:DNA-binding NtrC family response regulator